jgi:hypothetical protein
MAANLGDASSQTERRPADRSDRVPQALFDASTPRRIYTDGRDFPKDQEPNFLGYSIGKDALTPSRSRRAP